jgi:hypothetical protein
LRPKPPPPRQRGTARRCFERARAHGSPPLCPNKVVSLALPLSLSLSLSLSVVHTLSLPLSARAAGAFCPRTGPRRQGRMDCHARPAPRRGPVLPPRREAGHAAPPRGPRGRHSVGCRGGRGPAFAVFEKKVFWGGGWGRDGPPARGPGAFPRRSGLKQAPIPPARHGPPALRGGEPPEAPVPGRCGVGQTRKRVCACLRACSPGAARCWSNSASRPRAVMMTLVHTG